MDRTSLTKEAREVQRDLIAFKESRDVLGQRMGAMDETRLEEFERWACTQVLMNAFVLAIVRCEGLLEDYQKMIDELPGLELVREDENE